MSYGLIDYNTLKDIGDAIRLKTNSNRNYYPRDMSMAINQIKTGDGGFDEPTVLSVAVNHEGYPSTYITSGFEFLNTAPINGSNGTYYLITEDCSIPILSPDKVSLYFHSGPNGYTYALQVDGNKWTKDQISIMDIHDQFTGDWQIINPYCGKYTVNMFNAYYGCGQIVNPVCGNTVSDFSHAYESCSNILHAVCSDSVTNMAYSYAQCSNLLTANIGNNVENISHAFSGCSNLTGDIIIPNSVRSMGEAFSFCNNLNSIRGNTSSVVNASYGFGTLDTDNVFIDWENFKWNSLVYANSLFVNQKNMEDAEGFLYLQYCDNMFANCQNLKNVAIYSNSILIATQMFRNCISLTQESHDNMINRIPSYANKQKMFENCINIHTAHITNHMIDSDYISRSAYMYFGVPITNVEVDDNITTMREILSWSNIVNAVWPTQITDANNTYDNCHALINAYCGPFVEIMENTFSNCTNLIHAYCGPNTVEMRYTYQNCVNIQEAICGQNVTNMSGTYTHCNNLLNAVCGPKVTKMYHTYSWCPNLRHIEIGENVTNIYSAFARCNNLSEDIEINNIMLDNLAYAFQYSDNLGNVLIKSESLKADASSLQYAFYRTTNIKERNIVLTNWNSFNNIIRTSYNAFGPGFYHGEVVNHAEPVVVYVNNIPYDTYHSVFNNSLRTHIYCTE